MVPRMKKLSRCRSGPAGGPSHGVGIADEEIGHQFVAKRSRRRRSPLPCRMRLCGRIRCGGSTASRRVRHGSPHPAHRRTGTTGRQLSPCSPPRRQPGRRLRRHIVDDHVISRQMQRDRQRRLGTAEQAQAGDPAAEASVYRDAGPPRSPDGATTVAVPGSRAPGRRHPSGTRARRTRLARAG